jgi:type III secretory pathway lipoprotein EscJ
VPEQANEALAALSTAGVIAEGARQEGLSAAREAHRWRARWRCSTRKACRASASPAWATFRKEGLIAAGGTRARYVYACRRSCRALSRIDGVTLRACTWCCLSARRPVRPRRPRPRCFIKHQAQSNMDNAAADRLVTNAILGLTSERVSLVLVPSALAATFSVAPADELPGVPSLACGPLALAGPAPPADGCAIDSGPL